MFFSCDCRITETNKNVITVSPAVPSLGKYGLSVKDYTATALNYVVKGRNFEQDFG
ncbi:hypothetical protein KAI37_01702 [Paenibacillus sp. S25]|nr:hypothetical protein KAI37_01702 [Paenibacillus sp. S25]